MFSKRFAFLTLLGAAVASGSIAVAQSSTPANSNPAAVTAGRYTVELGHTRVQFTVSHMGFTNWYGDLTGASGSLTLDPKNPAASNLDISLPVASVSTTNAKLDGELRSSQWLDADGFPTIRFVSTRIEREGLRAATVTGNLTFHGVTKPVALKTVFNGAAPIRSARPIRPGSTRRPPSAARTSA